MRLLSFKYALTNGSSPSAPPSPLWYIHIPPCNLHACTQEPTLFGLSIKDNVTYGLEREVTDEEVMDAFFYIKYKIYKVI